MKVMKFSSNNRVRFYNFVNTNFIMKRLLVFLSLTLSLMPLAAQTDDLFWFAAPDISSVHGDPPQNGAPINLHITAVHATTVTIERPADPFFTPIVFPLDELEHRSIRLDNIMAINEIENYPQPWPLAPGDQLQGKAFKITSSPGEITAYYELDNYYNRDIFPLKGRNGMGTDFYVSTQNYFPNGVYGGTAFSGFVVAATENGTKIEVFPNDDWLYFAPHPASIVITLDAGQTFAFRAEVINANRHINGVRVKSDKKIVVTQYDDSIRKKNTNTANCSSSISYDVCGDQTIPLELIGLRYIVMKGQVTDAVSCDRGERIFITSTSPGTGIYVDGTLVTTMVNAGEVYNYLISNNYTLIEATRPVYIFHTTGYGGELGGAVLPTIDGCTGSRSVTFTRTPNAGDSFFLNLMARNDTNNSSPAKNKSAKSFTILANAVTTVIPENYFDYILDSAWVVLKKTPAVAAFISSKIVAGAEARVDNSTARFHLGIINGGASSGCKYGYFSDYKSENVGAGIGGAYAIKQYARCSLDPLQLVAGGGQGYKWVGVSNPNDTVYLSSTTIADPFFSPPYEGDFKFRVLIDLECKPDTFIDLRVLAMVGPVAQFDIEENVACSPFAPVFTNHTDMTKAKSLQWNFDTRYNVWINNNTLTNPFNWPYPENLTDSVQEYTIQLLAKGLAGNCPSIQQKKVRVLPNVKAGFTGDGNLGCNPLTVTFTDTSFGTVDTLNSYWDFVTYQQIYTHNPTYTFNNNHQTDTTYDVRLIAFSLFGCSDTAHFPVTVHPFINATFGVDNLTGCSPFQTTVNPAGSVGVNTFFWSVNDADKSQMDSSFTRNTMVPFAFDHNDATQPNPDTLFMSMYGENAYGCPDTAITKRLIIYPEVHASFIKSEDEICDSVDVSFINNSVGYRLMHEWNLGDGASFIDTMGIGFTHRYFNRTLSDKDYVVSLVTTSDYFCSDTLFDTITVHPFVKANFAIDFENSCTPLSVILTNISLGGSQFDWNFGDGSTQTTFTPDTLSHIFVNNTDNDTTYFIRMRAVNAYGCADSMERSVFLYPQVAANFDFDSPNSGCNPLTVSFINASKGKNVNYNWDFGDNTSSASPAPPSKLYKNNTNHDTLYYVTLTVTNPVGCDSSMTKPVQVYSAVMADFSISRLDSCSPFKIRIDNFSSGGITDFIWKYTPTDSLVLHDFSDPIIPVYRNTTLSPKEYEIRLRALNSHGCEAIKRDTITVFPEVFASFTPDMIKGCQPLSINFDNNTNIIPGTSFFWDFDDGRYSNKVTPEAHIFSNTATVSTFHDVQLMATSQYGCYDDTTVRIEVYPYIYANFTIDRPAICSDELFEIDRSNSRGGINHYYWDYENDGSTDEDKTDSRFFHTYTNTGSANFTREIKLTVTNAQGCDTSWTEQIIVYPQVRAAFSVDDAEFCYPHTSVFDNNSGPAVPLTYQWDFGDGSTSVEENPRHTYENYSQTTDQTHSVTLTVVSEFGCDSTVSSPVTIHPKPRADFTYPVTIDCPPFTVEFTDNSKGTNLSYAWDFDNGNTSSLMNPTQVFDNDGSSVIERQIQLVVTTEYLCGDTAVKPVQIYPHVEVGFTASAWSGCNPLEVNFDGTATNENEYYWYVDDKVFSNYQDPYYRFVNETASDKIFNIRFQAISVNGCSDDTVRQVTVYSKPTGEFMPDPVVQDYNTATDITPVTISNYTGNQPAWNYEWNFGDGTTSAESAPSFTKEYTIWGDIHNGNRIVITMTVRNESHPECSDTVERYVVINPPLPQVELGPDVEGCMPLEVEFPSTTKYIYEDSCQWDFNYEDMTSTEKYPPFIVFDTAGIYMIRLTVQGDGGTNWDYKKVIVFPKPVIGFTFAPDTVLLASQNETETPVKFFNFTYNGVHYWWDFGDKTYSTEFEPSHVYNDTIGHYYITLTAESGDGCFDTLTHPTPLTVEGARLIQFPDAFVIYPSGPADEYYDPNTPDERVFRPITQGVKKYKLEIYNRWGEVIWVSEDVNKGWNGYIQGSPAKQDVYVWKVSVTFTDGKPYVEAGNVTLLVGEQKTQ
jgi:PKD repeat protein